MRKNERKKKRKSMRKVREEEEKAEEEKEEKEEEEEEEEEEKEEKKWCSVPSGILIYFLTVIFSLRFFFLFFSIFLTSLSQTAIIIRT